MRPIPLHSLIGCLAALAVSLVLCGSAFGVTAVPLTDLAGTTLARLPVMQRGDVRIVPLSSMANWGGFESEIDRGKYRISSTGCLTILEPRNSFAEVNGAFVQMHSAAEVWDGSLWLPLVDLDELFPTTIELSDSADSVRLLGILDSTSGIVKPLTDLQVATPWSFGKVILDPGHGGRDPGGHGPGDLIEKDLVLDIARRAELALKKEGIAVALTRRDDSFLSLAERTRQANAEAGDLFLSIHCNSNSDARVNGAECYILQSARSERAEKVAQDENRVVELERDGERTKYVEMSEANFILMTMATSQYLLDSERWAGILLSEVSDRAGIMGRAVDQAGFYVLMGAAMPAVLLECGYLSNAEDARLLASDRGRQMLAEAIAGSVVKMKVEMEAAAR
ncbi:MAG: N-acetylmuramoyl-L-alanine amidase [bacterium]|nr:N-acetylmuramoyl-L-alanine amidase [bacterium]MBK8130566.1 N-acetylmuramoyl-L-alanine amidase [bacterium]